MKLKDIKTIFEWSQTDGLRIDNYNQIKKWIEIVETIDSKDKKLGRVNYKEITYPSEEEQERFYEKNHEYLRPNSQMVRLNGRKFEIGFVHDGQPMWIQEVDD